MELFPLSNETSNFPYGFIALYIFRFLCLKSVFKLRGKSTAVLEDSFVLLTCFDSFRLLYFQITGSVFPMESVTLLISLRIMSNQKAQEHSGLSFLQMMFFFSTCCLYYFEGWMVQVLNWWCPRGIVRPQGRLQTRCTDAFRKLAGNQ